MNGRAAEYRGRMSDSKDTHRTYLGVGVAFLGLAVVMFITMDSWAIALPFAVLASTFLILGSTSAKSAKPKKGDS